MTLKEAFEIARNVYKTTEYPAVKKMLGAFADECPGCGAGYEHWRIIPDENDPPIEECGNFHIVRWTCGKCGHRFKRMEEVYPTCSDAS